MTEQSRQTEVAAPGQAERRRATQVGTVTSIAGVKSVVVRVDRRVRDARYSKYVNRRSKVMAHDERSESGVGDVVEIVSTRPLSASKRWRVRRIMRKAVVVRDEEVQP